VPVPVLRMNAPGGATTVHATGQNALSFPAANLPDDERTRFAIGNSFFKRNWVEEPASTQARDGLGPHFIARSCGGCHATSRTRRTSIALSCARAFVGPRHG
jgi:CxxC motif-containing protein (DUF1111 family)